VVRPAEASVTGEGLGSGERFMEGSEGDDVKVDYGEGVGVAGFHREGDLGGIFVEIVRAGGELGEKDRELAEDGIGFKFDVEGEGFGDEKGVEGTVVGGSDGGAEGDGVQMIGLAAVDVGGVEGVFFFDAVEDLGLVVDHGVGKGEEEVSLGEGATDETGAGHSEIPSGCEILRR